MYTRLILLLINVFLLSSCVLSPVLNHNDNVTKKANERWLALIEHQWTKAYQFETKGYRDTHSVELFKAKIAQRFAWQPVTVEKVVLDEAKTTAEVYISLPFKVFIPGFGMQSSTSHIVETWLLDDGEWWHYTE